METTCLIILIESFPPIITVSVIVLCGLFWEFYVVGIGNNVKNGRVQHIRNNIVLGSTFCSQIRSLMRIANSALAARLQLAIKSKSKFCDTSSNKVNTVSRMPSDGWTIVVFPFVRRREQEVLVCDH